MKGIKLLLAVLLAPLAFQAAADDASDIARAATRRSASTTITTNRQKPTTTPTKKATTASRATDIGKSGTTVRERTQSHWHNHHTHGIHHGLQTRIGTHCNGYATHNQDHTIAHHGDDRAHRHAHYTHIKQITYSHATNTRPHCNRNCNNCARYAEP